ncbi:hypothetical protein [Natrarchaeobius oligotrophus]|nr:hypothetical protein [Natrarchaeobius chitinivorans]
MGDAGDQRLKPVAFALYRRDLARADGREIGGSYDRGSLERAA